MSVKPIVLAEDNATLRRAYSELLQAAGFKVMTAADGEKVVDLMHRIAKPLAIILDVVMPRMDGIEACRRIRKIQGLRTCPILFLTALDNPQTMLECLEAGGDDFMMKSLPSATILERVQAWARRGDAEENVARRQRAIAELEAIIQRSEAERKRLDATDDIDAEPTLKKLAAYVTRRRAGFPHDDVIYRFGYLVGLFEAYAPKTIHDRQAFQFFLKKLIFKTGFIDPRDVDALLGNYQRLVRQSLFQRAWAAGRGDAPKIEALNAAGAAEADEADEADEDREAAE